MSITSSVIPSLASTPILFYCKFAIGKGKEHGQISSLAAACVRFAGYYTACPRGHAEPGAEMLAYMAAPISAAAGTRSPGPLGQCRYGERPTTCTQRREASGRSEGYCLLADDRRKYDGTRAEDERGSVTDVAQDPHTDLKEET